MTPEQLHTASKVRITGHLVNWQTRTPGGEVIQIDHRLAHKNGPLYTVKLLNGQLVWAYGKDLLPERRRQPR